MNIEALLVIGGFMLALGLVLYIPGHFIAKHILRKAPADSSARERIRPLGILFYGLMVALLFAVFSMQYIQPDTALGQLASTSIGRLVIGGGVVAVWIVLETLFAAFGIKFITREQSAAPRVKTEKTEQKEL